MTVEISDLHFSPRESDTNRKKEKGLEGGAHLCPLSVGLDHEYDAGVGLIKRVSVQESLA